MNDLKDREPDMIVSQAALQCGNCRRNTVDDNRQRAQRMALCDLSFIDNPSFADEKHSARSISGQLDKLAVPAAVNWDAPRGVRIESAQLVQLCSTPLLKPNQEQDLFRLMNYAKFRAHSLQAQINPRRPNLRKLESCEAFADLAHRSRNHIVNANVRLVVSIVKKFADYKNTFDELFSEGVLSLMRATDKFDYARGFRFSTYATCAVRRELANFVDRQARRRTRFTSGVGDLMQSSLEPQLPKSLAPAVHANFFDTLQGLMESLDNRERMILKARYGLEAKGEKKRTFQNLGDELGVCKERVRQLEARALQKLRSRAHEIGFDPELARS